MKTVEANVRFLSLALCFGPFCPPPFLVILHTLLFLFPQFIAPFGSIIRKPVRHLTRAVTKQSSADISFTLRSLFSSTVAVLCQLHKLVFSPPLQQQEGKRKASANSMCRETHSSNPRLHFCSAVICFVRFFFLLDFSTPFLLRFLCPVS